MAVLAEDTFVDTNGTVITAHTPTGTTPGTSWSTSGGASALLINSNRIYDSGAADTIARGTLEKATAYPDDYAVQMDLVFLTDADDWPEINARANATDYARYAFGYEAFNAEWRLEVCAAGGGRTLLDSAAMAWPGAVTKVVRIEVEGSAINCYVDDVLTCSATDATITSGKPGLTMYLSTAGTTTTGFAVDNFSCSSLVSASAALTGTATASISESDIV